MPTKTKITKLAVGLQLPGIAPMRRIPARPAGLYLLELRANTPNNLLPKRKLVINIDAHQWVAGVSRPVKIKYA